MKQLSIQSIRIAVLGGVLLAGLNCQQATAQMSQEGQSKANFSIGGSYEMRSQHPQNGFGIRLENQLPLGIPLLAIAVRAQYSNFTEQKNKVHGFGRLNHDDVYFHRKLNQYYLGLMALAELRLGLITPYAGLGIGTSRLKVENANLHEILESGGVAGSQNKQSIYYEGALGASVTLLPVLHPFVEYRLQKNNFRDVINGYKAEDSSGIWAFGVSLEI